MSCAHIYAVKPFFLRPAIDALFELRVPINKQSSL